MGDPERHSSPNGARRCLRAASVALARSAWSSAPPADDGGRFAEDEQRRRLVRSASLWAVLAQAHSRASPRYGAPKRAAHGGSETTATHTEQEDRSRASRIPE